MRFFRFFENSAQLLESWKGEPCIGLLGVSASQNLLQNRAWNHLLRSLEIPAVYLPFDLKVPEEGAGATLKRVLCEAESTPEIIGFKIAPPYKKEVFRVFQKNAVGAAGRLGLANTLAKKKGEFFCSNTDGEGMYHNLLEAFGPLRGKVFLLLGAGGAATSIADRLLEESEKIILANRTLEKAFKLKAFLEKFHTGRVDVIPAEDIPHCLSRVDCVINTTPVGREGGLESLSSLARTDLSPLENNQCSEEMLQNTPERVSFASTLYRPEKELLLRQAERSGHRIVNGLGMWLYQAAVAARDSFFPDQLRDISYRDIASLLRENLMEPIQQ